MSSQKNDGTKYVSSIISFLTVKNCNRYMKSRYNPSIEGDIDNSKEKPIFDGRKDINWTYQGNIIPS